LKEAPSFETQGITYLATHVSWFWKTQILNSSDPISGSIIIREREREQINIFERKVYRRILGPVYDNEKHNWSLLTNKEIYASVKNPTITETVRLNRLRWFGHVQRMEENRIPRKVLYMNLKATRLRCRPRNRWQDKVREDGSLVGRKGCKERIYNREEWKKL